MTAIVVRVARRRELHRLLAREDRRVRGGRAEIQLPGQDAGSEADRHLVFLQGRLHDPDQHPARRRGHLVLAGLPPAGPGQAPVAHV